MGRRPTNRLRRPTCSIAKRAADRESNCSTTFHLVCAQQNAAWHIRVLLLFFDARSWCRTFGSGTSPKAAGCGNGGGLVSNGVGRAAALEASPAAVAIERPAVLRNPIALASSAAKRPMANY